MTIPMCGRWMERKATKLRNLLGALVGAFTFVFAIPASAAGPFASFDGAWRGSGSVTLSEGKKEKLTCKAYYNPKNAGSGLSIALTCASASSKIELRAALVASGSKVSGTWEERAYNSEGQVAGTVNGQSINLSVSVTLQASMKIKLGDSSQSVAIRTDGTGFKSVALTLARN